MTEWCECAGCAGWPRVPAVMYVPCIWPLWGDVSCSHILKGSLILQDFKADKQNSKLQKKRDSEANKLQHLRGQLDTLKTQADVQWVFQNPTCSCGLFPHRSSFRAQMYVSQRMWISSTERKCVGSLWGHYKSPALQLGWSKK